MAFSIVHIDATDVTLTPLFTDQERAYGPDAERWSIRIVDNSAVSVVMTGRVDEFDEALARLGEHIVSLRARIRDKHDARLALVLAEADRAGVPALVYGNER